MKKRKLTLRFLTLLTERMVVPLMKLYNMRRNEFGEKDDDFILMH